MPARPLESFRLWLEGEPGGPQDARSGDSGGFPSVEVYRAIIPDWRPMAKTHGQNARLHWAQRSKQAKMDRFLTATTLQNARWPRQLPWPRAIVLVTMVCKRGLPDSDALAGMGKSIRDACARYLGHNDSPRGPITWRYRFERGDRDGVRLELWEDKG